MNRIYRDAAHVLVWLGMDDKGEARSAFELVDQLDRVLGRDGVNGVGQENKEEELVNLERHVRENHMALRTLTNRPWVSHDSLFQCCMRLKD
jgi:hypothetical protein